jgi:TldD protein
LKAIVLTVLPAAIEKALFSSSLTPGSLESSLRLLQRKNSTFFDLFLQSYKHEVLSYEDSKVKNISLSQACGVGFRAVCELSTGFASTTCLSQESLDKAARQAASLAGDPLKNRFSPSFKPFYNKKPVFEADSLALEEKMTLLAKFDSYARQLDSDIYQVSVQLSTFLSYHCLLNDLGQIHYGLRPMVRVDLQLFAQKGGKRESAYVGSGGAICWKDHLTENFVQSTVQEAYRQLLVSFEAQNAPSGQYDLVLGPGWPGILLHEAVGHGLEADFNRKKTSVYSDKIGQQIASPHCTVIDDGTIEKLRGYIGVDDEGTEAKKNVLIEKGVLKSYMNDRQNAHLMKMQPTGNGRRESFMSPPMPRMTNTYLENGDFEHEEILESLKDGIYAPNFGGGSVDITSGQFVFTAQEAYRVKNGKILYPVKDMTIIGNGPEVMKNILMVGNNLQMDSGIGTCGKNGQSVPVGVGQPTVKISQVTLGGTDV